MHSSIATVEAIDSDRARQAEAACRAREGSQAPTARQRPRRRLRDP